MTLNRPPRSPLARLLLLLAPLLLTACSGTFLAGGPGLDAGTIAVSDVESGIGAHAEVGHWWYGSDSDRGVILGAGIAGFTGEADGDPIGLTTLEGRYRRPLGEPGASVRPFYELGAGPVLTWLAGPQQGGLLVHASLGIGGTGSVGWWLALRERPMVFFGDQAEFISSTQLVLGVELGADRRGGTSGR